METIPKALRSLTIKNNNDIACAIVKNIFLILLIFYV